MALRASKRWNWPCITILVHYRNRLKPTNFFEEAKILKYKQSQDPWDHPLGEWRNWMYAGMDRRYNATPPSIHKHCKPCTQKKCPYDTLNYLWKPLEQGDKNPYNKPVDTAKPERMKTEQIRSYF